MRDLTSRMKVFISYLRSNISTHHGITKILINGYTEEVIVKIISVEVSGRVIHRNACLVPHEANGADGF